MFYILARKHDTFLQKNLQRLMHCKFLPLAVGCWLLAYLWQPDPVLTTKCSAKSSEIKEINEFKAYYR
jgi:hypothetical protein